MKKSNSWILLLILLCLTTSVGLAADSRTPKGIITLSVTPAPALKLNDIDGKPFDLVNTKGRWRFVHFWATWCGPCRREMPTIQRMVDKLNSDRLKVVLINTAEDDDKVFSFLGIVAPDLNPLMDYDGQVTEQWQPRGLPSTYFVDPTGMIRYVALGGRAWDEPEYLSFIQTLIE